VSKQLAISEPDHGSVVFSYCVLVCPTAASYSFTL